MSEDEAAGPDPRELVTPESFVVAPEVLGLPLAPPWRRAFALLADLLVIALLANTGGVVLGLALALAFLRIATKSAAGRRRAGWVRTTFGCLGAAALLSVGAPTSKDDCKNGGWQTFDSPAFANQGQCIAFVVANGNDRGGGG